MKPERYGQVKQLFAAAVEREAAERAEYLKSACAGDEELRAEVESLLAHDEPAAKFIEESAFDVAARLLADDDARALTARRLGAYRVLGEIGRGGMGVVYLAERADEEFRQRVALKVIKRGLDTEEVRRRFRTERQILASLNHPNIARLLDGGTTEDGLPYFVMEYVEGLPLLSYCDAHVLATDARLRLFREVCAAVSHAHQSLVIHRDLKPSNILVTPAGEVKLLDFGVAKLLDPEPAGDAAALTQTGLRVLTPEYASPEQVRGERLTTATDVYSLGVLLYEMLTGAKPYRLKDASPEELSRAICDTEPSKPSEAFRDAGTQGRGGAEKGDDTSRVSASPRLRVVSPQLRGDIDNIVLMALRKEPLRRYGSVAQFSEDIERHLKGLPVVARKDTFSYRASKFVRRHRAGVAAASLVALAIMAGLVGTVWQARAAARERDQARREQAKAEQLNKFLQSILSAASPEEKGKDAKVIEVLNDAAERVETEFSAQPVLKGQALLTIGQTYDRLGLVDQAEKTLREALSVNASLYGAENAATASSTIYLCVALINKGKLDEAEPLLTRAVETERRLSPAGGKDLALALQLLGELRARQGEYAPAVAALQESVAMSDKLSGERNEDSAFALVSLGNVKLALGDTGGAEATFDRSITAFRALPRRYESRMALALIGLGTLRAQKGDYNGAIKTLLEADRIGEKQGDSLFLFGSKARLCTAYLNHGDYGNATGTCARAVEVGRRVGLADTPDFIVTLDYLGLSLTRTGRGKEGEPLLRESLERAKKELPPADVRTPLIESALGECLTAQGRFAEAEPLVVHGYESLKASQGEKSPLTALALRRAVELYERWKKPNLAAKYRTTTTPQS